MKTAIKTIFSIIFTLCLMLHSIAFAEELFIETAYPIVKTGGQIILTVTNAKGSVKWSAFEGKIERHGSSLSVIYHAPETPAIDAVTVFDSSGNAGSKAIITMTPEDIEKYFSDKYFSQANSSWELFTNRSYVRAVLLSDDKSILWIGTSGGLEERNPFTGELKKYYTKQKNGGLPGNNISALLSDGNGGVWIGTDSGLANLKKDGTWVVFDKTNSELSDNDISALYSDRQGGLWVGISDKGLAHLKSDKIWEVLNKDNSQLPDNDVNSLISDGQGGLWVGTSEGLAHLKSDKTWEELNRDNSQLPSNSVKALYPDNQGGLWAGTYKGLVHLKSDGTWDIFNTENSYLPDNFVSSLCSDGSGGIWAGTNEGLAYLKSNNTWEVFNTENSVIPDNYINTIYSDGFGNLWIGTAKGLAYLNSDNTWKVFDNDNGDIPNNAINCLFSDKNGEIWVGTDNGLARMNSNREWTVYNTSNSRLTNNKINTLISDNDEGIWIGTQDGAVRRQSNNSMTPHLLKDTAFNITSMLYDKKGRLWVGRTGNPNILAQWNFSKSQLNTYLEGPTFNSLISDESEGIWAGTSGTGLVYIKSDDTWDNLNIDNSGLPNNYIEALLLDGQGGLWIGTYNGLAHMKSDDTWEIFNTDNSGLPYNYLYSLLSDGHDGLWVGTLGGLAHMKSNGTWDVFNKDNSGLPNNYINALLLDSQGGLWVGTLGGLAHLQFLSISEAEFSGELFITPAFPVVETDEETSIVEINHEITFSINNANGTIRCSTFNGEVKVNGNSVIYKAPSEPVTDIITVIDSAGNRGTIKIRVNKKVNTDYIALTKNDNWDVYTNRAFNYNLLVSDDNKTLWVATTGGLEERDAVDGHLKQLYTNQNGLPDNNTVRLLSDGQGGIWVGTWGGGIANLKVDRTWDTYCDKNNSALPSNNIWAFLSDGNGGLWIGTDTGLAHLMPNGLWEIFDKNNSSLPHNAVYSLLSDDDGGIWIGTGKWGDGGDTSSSLKGYGSLSHFKSDGTWDIFDETNSGMTGDPWRVISDTKGGIWIGTFTSGVLHLNSDGKWESFNENNSGLPENDIRDLASDGEGGIWTGHGQQGLSHLKEDGSWSLFKSSSSSLPNSSVYGICPDKQGGVWIGTHHNLAHLYSDSTWEVFDQSADSTLPIRNEILYKSLCSDNQGGIWVGGSYDGLGHLKSDGTWEVITRNSYLLTTTIYSLIPDEQSGLWVGTYRGLGHLKSDRTWDMFTVANSPLPYNHIVDLVSDNMGGVWMIDLDQNLGQGVGVLAHLEFDGSWEIFEQYYSDFPTKSPTELLSDGKGGLWVGTKDGLAHLKSDGTWEIFNKYNSDLPDNNAYTLASDENGGVWVGYHGGLAHLKSDGVWEVFNNRNSSLPYIIFSSLLSDGKGGVWGGTGDFDSYNTVSGLIHFKSDGTLELFDQSNSDLPDNKVSSMISDKKGGLWVGTENGLGHFILTGTPEQINRTDSPDINITWFLNSSPFDYQRVQYIELERSLSQTGIYETVYDSSGNPVRFNVDYSNCSNPNVDNCCPSVDGHIPAMQGEGATQIKGYTLNTPIVDTEWLEGLPRYYRLSAVIEKNGELVRVGSTSEATLMSPFVEEKPRVELTLDKNAIAMQPNQKAEITVFVSSLDLFRGDVALEVVSGEDAAIFNNTNIKLEPATVSLKAGETKPVLLTIDALSENLSASTGSTIKIIPKIQSGYSGKSTSLNIQVGDGTNSMIALSIAHKTKRTRVLDSLTISGNLIPAQAGQKVVISGNNIKESADSSNSPESADSNDSLTLTTDENGYFQGTVTPIHAGLLTLTAKSNEITSNNAEIFILPARTNIALSSNVNQSTKKGDTLRVQGIITPVRLDGTKVNLDIRYLDPANQDAGLQPQFVGGVEIDTNGVFYRDVVVPGNGFINVKASLPETSDYLSINTKLVVPIGQPVGEGIIVVSESGDAEFQTISKSLGSYVYNALKSRNIPAERIKYLGIADDPKFTSGTANKANLHDALTNWATSLFSTDDPYKTPLNLYLIGKVEDENNGFRLNDSEVLTADDLAQYLNEAEEIIKINSKDNYSEYKGFPVTIVLEGTQSGKWIEKIAGNGRIILTSSSDKPVDEGGFAGYDNLGESSFSRYFYEFINYGSDIEGSFAEANYEILKFYRHTQRPVMDADGNGVGTTNYDRYEASGKFIEYRPSGNLRPQIRTTNPDMTINRVDAQNNFLWAIATDPENEMGGVFCSICSITDPSNRTVNIEMKLDTGYFYKADLNQNYPNLGTGCYQAVYYAKDKAGNVSLPEEKFINVISSSGVLPQPPQIKITTKGNMVTVSWSEVQGADGYKLFYAPYPNPSPSDIGEIDMGKKREVSFDGKGFAFYGAVKAYNSNGLSELSNIEFFDLR